MKKISVILVLIVSIAMYLMSGCQFVFSVPPVRIVNLNNKNYKEYVKLEVSLDERKEPSLKVLVHPISEDIKLRKENSHWELTIENLRVEDEYKRMKFEPLTMKGFRIRDDGTGVFSGVWLSGLEKGNKKVISYEIKNIKGVILPTTN